MSLTRARCLEARARPELVKSRLNPALLVTLKQFSGESLGHFNFVTQVLFSAVLEKVYFCHLMTSYSAVDKLHLNFET